MQILNIVTATNAEQLALVFSACLAADKGVPSEILVVPVGFVVVADDGRAVLFEQQ